MFTKLTQKEGEFRQNADKTDKGGGGEMLKRCEKGGEGVGGRFGKC